MSSLQCACAHDEIWKSVFESSFKNSMVIHRYIVICGNALFKKVVCSMNKLLSIIRYSNYEDFHLAVLQINLKIFLYRYFQ